jgi:hypothetical protein
VRREAQAAGPGTAIVVGGPPRPCADRSPGSGGDDHVRSPSVAAIHSCDLGDSRVEAAFLPCLTLGGMRLVSCTSCAQPGSLRSRPSVGAVGHRRPCRALLCAHGHDGQLAIRPSEIDGASSRWNGVSTEVLRRTARAGEPAGSKAERCRSRVHTVSGEGFRRMEQAGSVDEDPADPAQSFKVLLEQLRQSDDWEQLPFSRRLRKIRKARHWSHQQLARRMILAGEKRRGRTASAASLVRMQSGWERSDGQVADERNRHLLADALEVEVADLGLSEDPDFIW